MSDGPDVTVYRPEPPRMTTLETSGGLKLTGYACSATHHVWVTQRGKQPKGVCECGAMVYKPATPATAVPRGGADPNE